MRHDPQARRSGRHKRPLYAWLGWFNRGVTGATGGYVAAVGQVVARPLRMLVVFAAICAGVYVVYTNLPAPSFRRRTRAC